MDNVQVNQQPIEPCIHGNVKDCPYCVYMVDTYSDFIGKCTNDDATRDLPIPHGTGPDIFPLVLLDLPSHASPGLVGDLQSREQYGVKNYGESLRAFNGRDIEVDTLQDGIDYVVYLRQCLEEGLDVQECYDLAVESIVLFYKVTGR